MTNRSTARQGQDDRSAFDRFVEGAYQHVSRAPFFAVIIVLIVAWLLSAPLWVDLKAWQVAIHTVGTVISLILLVLLENAGRRSEEAAQEKLNVLAEALADLMASRAQDDPALEESVARLREAVGLEDRH
ncbi:low affinity iron permease family protein [Aeromicrobium stalagmiti]|uniref:low affinity iron permease family protein n=1 Tax=Aeromicrobium stalagmiti TaxID=2738988 RepID=UPI0015682884|nr:low affinity iron permease family protein [Aeromicrobium stalagmiti]NRQ50684.1 low affinity iron permease family protein [Aeromicrobium stalagmiti]